MSTVKNADLWTFTLIDAVEEPPQPEDFEGVVSWWIKQPPSRYFDIEGNEIEPVFLPGTRRVDLDSVVATTQEPEDFVTPGIYQIRIPPSIAVPYEVKAHAKVGGVDQATPFMQAPVTP